MKTIIVTILALIFSLVNIFAQNVDYYSGKDRVKGRNYEYIIKKDTIRNYLKIYNVKNKITNYMSQALRNGKTISTPPQLPLVQMTEKRKDIQILKEVFTDEEIKRILDYNKSDRSSKRIDLALYVDLSGDLLEVTFKLKNSPEYRSIDPDKLYEFEQRLKKEVKFNIPKEDIEEYKKEFNFLSGGYCMIDLARLNIIIE